MKEYNKEYKDKNKEQIKEYREANKEYFKEYEKKYRKTDQGKKSQRIKDWKQVGLICEDYDKIYEIYINTWECDNCGIELIGGNRGSNKKCMDHSHRTGLFRNILCNKCNVNRIKYEPD